MTQAYLGQLNGAVDDGTDVVTAWNAFDTAHKSGQLGTSRPTGITRGGLWTRDNGNGTETLMLYDGAADAPVWRGGVSGTEISGNWDFTAGLTTFSGATTFPGNADFTGRVVINTPETVRVTLPDDNRLLVRKDDTNFVEVLGKRVSSGGAGIGIRGDYVDGTRSVITIRYGASVNFEVRANGDILSQNASLATISDERAKHEIADAAPALEDIMRLRAVNYRLIDDPEQTKLLGFVAQEMREVFPGLVGEGDDGVLSVKLTPLIPKLVKALQEQQAMIDDLAARLTALEQGEGA